ncbi:MAG: saccharopine dehydrogenase family protein [Desulfuromonadaceae bacterium]|nr:saccharopine dehydrogenase family protein [Desulfuromonadaceae bacterium]
MGKVLIIGAGGVGRVVAHKCAQAKDVFTAITLASRTKSKCDAIAAEITHFPIATAQVDADNIAEMVTLIRREKPDLVINVALPYQDLAIMEACLDTGVDYLDTANYEPLDTAKFEYHWQWAYHGRFHGQGIMALLGSGFDPGVTNVYTALAAKKYLDEIEEIDIIDANAGSHGQPFATNFNPEINIREVTAPCRHWENGRWVETPPLATKRSFDFPDGIGPMNIYRMYHEEMESLVKHFPTIRKAQFWMTFSDNYLNHLQVLQNVGMTRIDEVEFQGRKIVPLQFLKAVLPDPGSLGPLTKGRTCIGVVAKGTRDGRKKQVYIYNICDHQVAYKETNSQAISYTTGVPAVTGAIMMLTGTWHKPGVWNMEQFDPEPFLERLAHLGLPTQISEGEKWLELT